MKKQILTLLAVLYAISIHSQLVTPQIDGDHYSLTVGNVYFEVDVTYGARISSFTINETDILYQPQNASDNMWGSTLWPSPQTWPWPPPFETLELDPYTGEISENKIIMKSGIDDYNKLLFEKSFYAETSDSSITIEYTIINKGTSAKSVAAWEVSRVPSGGITFFPKGSGSITGAFANQFETIEGVAWYEHSTSDPASQKMFSDGSDGWFAHITEDNYLFLKTFEDVPYGSAAPNEAEIELWHAGTTTYIELENQSEYVSIPAGDTLNYNLKWYLKEIPENVVISTGSESLLDYIEEIVLGNQIDTRLTKRISGITLYPNPASEFVSFRGKNSSLFSIEIYNITGKKVLSRKGVKSTGRLFIGDLPEGLYIYRLELAGGSSVGKLFIE